MTTFLGQSPEAVTMADGVGPPPSPKRGVPVKVKQATYTDLKRIARVLGRDIGDLCEELIRAPLALRKAKLAPELAQLEKMERAEAELAEKARKKVAD